MAKAKGDNLTLKQKLFVEAYLGVAKGNATEAARIAGYKGNYQTLASVGAENLKKAQIASRVHARVEAAGMTADEVLNELAAVGRAEWKEFLQITHNRNGDIVDAKIVLKDKVRALELLGQYHSLFGTRIKVDWDIGSLSDEELAAAKASLAAAIGRA